MIKARAESMQQQAQHNAPPAWFRHAIDNIWEGEEYDHFDARQHVVNAINKMLETGELRREMDIIEVMAIVREKYPNGQRKPVVVDADQIPF